MRDLAINADVLVAAYVARRRRRNRLARGTIRRAAYGFEIRHIATVEDDIR